METHQRKCTQGILYGEKVEEFGIDKSFVVLFGLGLRINISIAWRICIYFQLHAEFQSDKWRNKINCECATCTYNCIEWGKGGMEKKLWKIENNDGNSSIANSTIWYSTLFVLLDDAIDAIDAFAYRELLMLLLLCAKIICASTTKP